VARAKSLIPGSYVLTAIPRDAGRRTGLQRTVKLIVSD
jgi:hypothetical protein